MPERQKLKTYKLEPDGRKCINQLTSLPFKGLSLEVKRRKTEVRGLQQVAVLYGRGGRRVVQVGREIKRGQ